MLSFYGEKMLDACRREPPEWWCRGSASLRSARTANACCSQIPMSLISAMGFFVGIHWHHSSLHWRQSWCCKTILFHPAFLGLWRAQILSLFFIWKTPSISEDTYTYSFSSEVLFPIAIRLVTYQLSAAVEIDRCWIRRGLRDLDLDRTDGRTEGALKSLLWRCIYITCSPMFFLFLPLFGWASSGLISGWLCTITMPQAHLARNEKEGKSSCLIRC